MNTLKRIDSPMQIRFLFLIKHIAHTLCDLLTDKVGIVTNSSLSSSYSHAFGSTLSAATGVGTHVLSVNCTMVFMVTIEFQLFHRYFSALAQFNTLTAYSAFQSHFKPWGRKNASCLLFFGVFFPFSLNTRAKVNRVRYYCLYKSLFIFLYTISHL